MDDKRQEILGAAIAIAEESGVNSIHGNEISKRSGVKQGNIHHLYGPMELIRQDVLKWAKANGRYDRFTDPLLLNRKRAEPAARRRHILACAVELAAEGHYRDVTRDQIAARAGISPGLITRCFTTMPQLRRDIVRAAIRDEVLPVIAQAIAHGDKRAAKLSPEVKQKALSSFVS